ncbi:MAG: ABC transporter substrate-binding protein [Sulfurimonas sp.]|jgi:iron complex transport system substrate-binding protein|nr:ABC transporter substrate-binding protein [Sulfurimonas sp.]
MLRKTLASFLLVLSLSLHSKVINENPQKIFGSSPPMNYLLYAINPQKMVGLNFSAHNLNNNANEKFLKKSFLDLPVIGSFHGSGQGMNVESILKYAPDLILVWEDDYLSTKVSQEIARTQIPSITLPFREIESMAPSILKVAEAIGESERGALLSSYTQERMSFIKELVAPLKAVRYYYAEGNDGLATECSDSFHVEALNYAGGENVHRCIQSNLRGLERITFETLLGYDPEVIIAQNAMVYKAIETNPLWKHLKAVKNKKVFLVPNTPFHWLDRPPSFMRIVGIEWLASKFYPEHYKTDLLEQIKKFYKLFLDVELSEEDMRLLVKPRP